MLAIRKILNVVSLNIIPLSLTKVAGHMDADRGACYIKKNSRKSMKLYSVKNGINRESEENKFNHTGYSRGIRQRRKRPEKPCVGSSILLLGTKQLLTLMESHEGFLMR